MLLTFISATDVIVFQETTGTTCSISASFLKVFKFGELQRVWFGGFLFGLLFPVQLQPEFAASV